MKLLVLLASLILFNSSSLLGQKVKPIDIKELNELLNKEGDTIYVINFWATWCAPCVNEIEYFKELHNTYSDSNLQVHLISLDFPTQINKRVIPFILERGLNMSIYNMTDPDYNKWIPLVSEGWSGAIPATLIYRKDKRKFIESEVSREQLFTEIKQFK